MIIHVFRVLFESASIFELGMSLLLMGAVSGFGCVSVASRFSSLPLGTSTVIVDVLRENTVNGLLLFFIELFK
jgi:hypothetical protein